MMAVMKKQNHILVLGRPNVGKSTLINRIAGGRRTITDDQPGVTRDLNNVPFEWEGRHGYLIDSGGVFFDPKHDAAYQKQIEARVQSMMAQVKQIWFILDYKTGLHVYDYEIAKALQAHKRKVILVVNKMDSIEKQADLGVFYKLGFSAVVGISAVHGLGLVDLMAHAQDVLIDQPEIDANKIIRIAIIGRPNVGKSSLVNAILNEERVIVDSRPGTTRDAVDAEFHYQNQHYIFVDTAGMRARARVTDKIEQYSVMRAKQAIETADIVIAVLEPEPFMTDQDKRLLSLVMDSGKPMLVWVNKWDVTVRTDAKRHDLITHARSVMPTLHYYPFIFGSAQEKIHLGYLFEQIPAILAHSQHRVSTPDLNRFLKAVIEKNPPTQPYGARVKLYYGTQVSTRPPTFVFFVSHATKINPVYYRFVEKRIREFFNYYEGVPIRIKFKSHHEDPAG